MVDSRKKVSAISAIAIASPCSMIARRAAASTETETPNCSTPTSFFASSRGLRTWTTSPALTTPARKLLRCSLGSGRCVM